MLAALSSQYACREGVPVINKVETAIFTTRYFSHCMQCGFCNDWCCSAGVQVDLPNISRITEHREPLEKLTGISHTRWFRGPAWKDQERPGGRFRRTNVIDGACVFLNRKGRGCLLHQFSLQSNIDYHQVKPIICSLFPLTFVDGVLQLAYEVRDKTLVCLDQGPAVYTSLRGELQYYFGDAMVAEMDEIALLHPLQSTQQP